MARKNSELIRDMIDALEDATIHALWEYQNSIILDHFKPGNRRRYKWPPVSREYYLRKVKKGHPPQQLVRTGELRDKTVGQGQVRKMGRSNYQIEWNSLPDYGIYQHNGAPPQKGPRPFTEPDQKDRARIEEEAQKYIDAQAQSAKRINPRKSL